jgi:hypothetical protein
MANQKMTMSCPVQKMTMSSASDKAAPDTAGDPQIEAGVAPATSHRCTTATHRPFRMVPPATVAPATGNRLLQPSPTAHELRRTSIDTMERSLQAIVGQTMIKNEVTLCSLSRFARSRLSCSMLQMRGIVNDQWAAKQREAILLKLKKTLQTQKKPMMHMCFIGNPVRALLNDSYYC